MTTSSVNPSGASSERLPASRRREATLAAASAVFAREGYHGATTERISQAAGISQPYTVRMFGSKADPVIGPVARDGFTRILTFLVEEAEMSIPEAEKFLARGMLMNTLLALRLHDHPGPLTIRLVNEVFTPREPRDPRRR
jgi:AcrR family transcriptional regulator